MYKIKILVMTLVLSLTFDGTSQAIFKWAASKVASGVKDAASWVGQKAGVSNASSSRSKEVAMFIETTRAKKVAEQAKKNESKPELGTVPLRVVPEQQKPVEEVGPTLAKARALWKKTKEEVEYAAALKVADELVAQDNASRGLVDGKKQRGDFGNFSVKQLEEDFIDKLRRDDFSGIKDTFRKLLVIDKEAARKILNQGDGSIRIMLIDLASNNGDVQFKNELKAIELDEAPVAPRQDGDVKRINDATRKAQVEILEEKLPTETRDDFALSKPKDVSMQRAKEAKKDFGYMPQRIALPGVDTASLEAPARLGVQSKTMAPPQQQQERKRPLPPIPSTTMINAQQENKSKAPPIPARRQPLSTEQSNKLVAAGITTKELGAVMVGVVKDPTLYESKLASLREKQLKSPGQPTRVPPPLPSKEQKTEALKKLQASKTINAEDGEDDIPVLMPGYFDSEERSKKVKEVESQLKELRDRATSRKIEQSIKDDVKAAAANAEALRKALEGQKQKQDQVLQDKLAGRLRRVVRDISEKERQERLKEIEDQERELMQKQKETAEKEKFVPGNVQEELQASLLRSDTIKRAKNYSETKQAEVSKKMNKNSVTLKAINDALSRYKKELFDLQEKKKELEQNISKTLPARLNKDEDKAKKEEELKELNKALTEIINKQRSLQNDPEYKNKMRQSKFATKTIQDLEQQDNKRRELEKLIQENEALRNVASRSISRSTSPSSTEEGDLPSLNLRERLKTLEQEKQKLLAVAPVTSSSVPTTPRELKK
ncbi:MAG: hypothetical protein WCT20_00325 [Candidatus Babeliales bacterium]